MTGLEPLIERGFAVLDPERTIILEAALEHDVLEDRGDGYLYLPDGSRGYRVFFNAFVTRWSRWPWSRWNKAGRALKGELKTNGRIHRLYDRAKLSRDFGVAESDESER